jgi:excisionase family DNA binding protein
MSHEPNLPSLPELLNRKTGARLIGVSIKTLDNLMDQGKLPYIKVGRQIKIHPNDLQSFISRNRVAVS